MTRYCDSLNSLASATRWNWVRITALLWPLLYCSVLFGQTEVGGRLNPNATWSRSGSPFIVTQNVEVPEGGLLTIEPGVEVRLRANYSIIVHGQLVARGDKHAPIRFTANAAHPQPQSWGLLQFEHPAPAAKHDAQYAYQSGSILAYAIIEYGHGLYFNGSAPFVSHCTIRYNAKERGGGIYANGCRPVIRECQIVNNFAEREGGGLRTRDCQPVLIDNVFARNSARTNGGGASIDYQTALIRSNKFLHNYAAHGGGLSTGQTQIGQTSVSGRSHSAPQILGNTIQNNVATYSGGGLIVRGTPVIRDNEIFGNRLRYTVYHPKPNNNARTERRVGAGAGMRVSDTYGGPLEIRDNLIAGNSGAFWGGGMCFDRAAGTVRNNLIAYNRVTTSGAALSILVRSPGRGIAGGNHGADWDIQGNEFRGNREGVIEFARARFGGKQSIQIVNCDFLDNKAPLITNRTQNGVRALGNWWGVANSSEVDRLIDDFADNQQFGQVTFRPATNPTVTSKRRLSDSQVFHRSHSPVEVRAGQGFDRLPGTPPSVTIVWNPGELKKPAGYLVHFARLRPRFDRVRADEDARVPAASLEGPSPVDVGDVLQATITGLEIGAVYEFSVSAYDDQQRESSVSQGAVVHVER